MMSLLYIAYSLLPVNDESAGGAEQVLQTLEHEIAARGHSTTIAACAGSRVVGELLDTGNPPGELDQCTTREGVHNQCVLEHLRSSGRHYDLIHDHSGSFWPCARLLDIPVLATLHLPRHFYPAELFDDLPPNCFFNCVSEAQRSSFADLPRNLGVVRNGICIERFPFTPRKQNYLLWLGRICEEKGTHIAIDVAARIGVPLVIAGQVYPFSYHHNYFEHMIGPHLSCKLRLVESPSFEDKVELLRHARAVLIPSLCEETSSLVALEAMACGTPVIAFRRGGIPEVVLHHETGFVVDTNEEMAAVVAQVGAIDPRAFRARVESQFTEKRMADDYELVYSRLLAADGGPRPCPSATMPLGAESVLIR